MSLCSLRFIFSLSLIFFLLRSSLKASASSVLAVDLGSAYVKSALLRPSSGIEIVLNEQAKRKTPTAIAFTLEGERLFGDAALAYASKYPQRAILDPYKYLGECDYQSATVSDPCPHFKRDIEPFRKAEGMSFVPEEIVAMLLGMVRSHAEALLREDASPNDASSFKTSSSVDPIVTIHDIVITVPAWFDQRQRLAVFDAAKIAGINCLGVINANAAVSLKYATDNKAQKDNETALFIDVGATGTTVSVAQIAKLKDKLSVKILANAFDKSLGGNLMDQHISEILMESFDKQLEPYGKLSKNLPKVRFRLMKEATRLREILSANSEALSSIEGLFEEIDFRMLVTRDQFEQRASSTIERIVNLIKEVLEAVQKTSKDIDAVVPFGGAHRVPLVQSKISDALGIESLTKSINADEAAAFGAAFFGAMYSTSFRVRKTDFADAYPRPISVDISREESSKKSSQKSTLFPLHAKLPSKKTMSLKRSDDFNVTLIYPETDIDPSYKIACYSIQNVKKVLEMRQNESVVVPEIKVTLSIELDRSGLLQIVKAESTIEEIIRVEKVIKDKADKTTERELTKTKKVDGLEEEATGASDETTKGKKFSDSTGDEIGDSDSVSENDLDSEEANENMNKDLIDLDATDAKQGPKDSSNTPSPAPNIEVSYKTIIHRNRLNWTPSTPDVDQYNMNASTIVRLIKRYNVIEKEAMRRKEYADTYNSMEGFIIDSRYKMTEEDIERVSTVEERDDIMKSLESDEDWIYTEDAKDLDNLKKRYKRLKDLVSPVLFRAYEMVHRPLAVESMKQVLKTIREQYLKAKEGHEKVASVNLKRFLEKDLEGQVNEITTWLTKVEAEQQEKKPHENPVFSSSDCNSKISELLEKAKQTLMIPAKAPNVKVKKTEQKIKDGTSEDDLNSNTFEDIPEQEYKRDEEVSSEENSNEEETSEETHKEL